MSKKFFKKRVFTSKLEFLSKEGKKSFLEDFLSYSFGSMHHCKRGKRREREKLNNFLWVLIRLFHIFIWLKNCEKISSKMLQWTLCNRKSPEMPAL